MEYKDIKNFTGINRGVSPFLTIEGEMSDNQNVQTEKIGVLKKTGDYAIKNTQITDGMEIYNGADYLDVYGTHAHLIAINGTNYANIYVDRVLPSASPSSSPSSTPSSSPSVTPSSSPSSTPSTSPSASPSIGSYLVAYYPLTGNSNDAEDSHDGTDTNITYHVDNGKVGQGAGFNGTTSKIIIPNHLDFRPTGNYSVAAWFKTSASGDYQTIFSSYDYDTTDKGIELFVDPTGYLVGKNSHSENITVTSVGTVNNGNWHLGVLTYDGTNINLYVDNLDVAQTANSTSPIFTANNHVCVGVQRYAGEANSEEYFFNGAIDEIRFYNGQAISASVVAELYAV